MLGKPWPPRLPAMTFPKLHADEFEMSTELVRSLIDAQFPEWASLQLRPFASAGSDHFLFRLGDELAVRLPRKPDAAGQTEDDLRWLPRFAGKLPLAIPQPVALGQATEHFPATWGVYRWLPGEPAERHSVHDLNAAAKALAGFVRALQAVDTAGGPHAGPLQRGSALLTRDEWTRENFAQLPPQFDQPALLAVWEECLATPAWAGAPVWLHNDLQSGNLLVQDGELSAVIDFGSLLVGDPAAELSVAWNWLDADARAVFRKALSVDEATWARGKGWALSIAAAEIPYYLHTNPTMVARSTSALGEVLAG